MCVKAAHRWAIVSSSLVEGAEVTLAAPTMERVAKAAVYRVITARITMEATLQVAAEHRIPAVRRVAAVVPERSGKGPVTAGITKPAAAVDTTVAAVLTRLAAAVAPAISVV